MSDLADELRRDLAAIEDRFANDNQFSRDLYRALANNTWHKEGAHAEADLDRAPAATDERTGGGGAGGSAGAGSSSA